MLLGASSSADGEKRGGVGGGHGKCSKGEMRSKFGRFQPILLQSDEALIRSKKGG